MGYHNPKSTPFHHRQPVQYSDRLITCLFCLNMIVGFSCNILLQKMLPIPLHSAQLNFSIATTKYMELQPSILLQALSCQAADY